MSRNIALWYNWKLPCEAFAEKKENVTPDMQFLAGLQRIDYVFVLPDSKDIVIAGTGGGPISFDAYRSSGGITAPGSLHVT